LTWDATAKPVPICFANKSGIWQNGIAIEAHVTEFVCDNPNATENRTYQIACEYEGPDGQTITGKSQSHSRSWFLRTAKGDVIDIVAGPKKPEGQRVAQGNGVFVIPKFQKALKASEPDKQDIRAFCRYGD